MPSTMFRVTFGTQSAASQKADAFPATGISAAIIPHARTGTAMSLLTSVPSGFRSGSARPGKKLRPAGVAHAPPLEFLFVDLEKRRQGAYAPD